MTEMLSKIIFEAMVQLAQQFKFYIWEGSSVQSYQGYTWYHNFINFSIIVARKKAK